MSRLTQSSPWQTLTTLAKDISKQHMRTWFQSDPERAVRYSMNACGITLDYSKNLINEEIKTALLSLAEEAQLTAKRQAMFAGEAINTTENRAVLHTALRNFSGQPVRVNGNDVMPAITASLQMMREFVHAIHSGGHRGYTGQVITDVVALGIGGSFLGPKIMSEALKPYWQNAVRVHFVANVDGCHIRDVLTTLDAATTVVVVSSKSFSTQETLQNTLTAKAWLLADGASQAAIAKHFVAVSSNLDAAVEFGIDPQYVFPMWDWVGGRYSLWSTIGLPLALVIGFENYQQMLRGAHAMDCHFSQAPLAQNMPVLMAMIGLWYRNFHGAQSYVLLPYYHYLRGFPAYVQQLDMESNGKRVAQDEIVNYDTGPIVWGSEGSNGQHSFHQLLHQSDTLIPADFILPLTVPEQDAGHHQILASHCFAQSQALMQGKTHREALAELAQTGSTQAALARHREMPGNKPSNTLLFEALTPTTLGSLVALYEHKIFVQGVVWNVNSFDQWGVELGKVLGEQILATLDNPHSQLGFDASTNQLIQRFRAVN